jgi:hypothetical protein
LPSIKWVIMATIQSPAECVSLCFPFPMQS